MSGDKQMMISGDACMEEAPVKHEPFEMVFLKIKEEIRDELVWEGSACGKWPTLWAGTTRVPGKAVAGSDVLVKAEVTVEDSVVCREYGEATTVPVGMNELLQPREERPVDCKDRKLSTHVGSVELTLPSGRSGHLLQLDTSGSKVKKRDQEHLVNCKIIPLEVVNDASGPTHTNRTELSRSYEASCVNNLNRNIKTTHVGDKPFSCSFCAGKFSYECRMKAHVRRHTGEKPFSCSLCSAKFTCKSDMSRHIRTHTGEKPYSCSLCSVKFAVKSSLVKHKRIHTGEKPFSCPLCSAKFMYESSMKMHISMHTGEKPFSCSLCSAEFICKSSLKQHIRRHTGEKLFSCSLCSSKFISKDDIKRHIRTHTGEKPFSCSVCAAKFTDKSNLSRHIRTHTREKPFSCSFCYAKFTCKSSLKKHTTTHTSEKLVSC